MTIDVATKVASRVEFGEATIPLVVMVGMCIDEVTTTIRYTIPEESAYINIDKIRPKTRFTTNDNRFITNVSTS